MEIEKTGIFSIVGRPNAGKSTLLNALAGKKIAIVTNKPQTTRSRVSAVVNRGNIQYVFTDTPGFHKPRTRLGDFMVHVVEESVEDTDAAVLVAEPEPPGKQELVLLEKMKQYKTPCILVINKIDIVKKESLLKVIASYEPLYDFEAVIPLSAKTGEGVELLLPELERFTQEGSALYPEGMDSDQPEQVFAAETVREKCLQLLDREIPHGIAIEIEKLEKRENGTVAVHALIYVEKESHKGIIIGKNGAMLKRIGELSRAQLERYFGSKVYLELWVKVKEGWRDNLYFMRNFGYDEG